MVDLVITAANVIPASDAVTELGVAGATITAGQVVYLDSADAKYKLADADSATAAIRSPIGIALNGASNGQPLKIHKSGSIVTGATMTSGLAYYLSKTAGGIAPVADIAAGGYSVFLGITTSTTALKVNITESLVAV